jgi:hypothetical protein
MSVPLAGAMPSHWQPDWPAHARVKALVTTRQGGFSLPPWDSFNLGDHVGDNAEHVQSNRALLAERTGVKMCFLNQVHGLNCAGLGVGSAAGHQADASATTEAGVACTILVADCLPVLFAHPKGTVVAAAHAGWRGLAGVTQGGEQSEGDVLSHTYKKYSDLSLYDNREFAIEFDSKSEAVASCMVWLGPCIGPRAFQVGEEVRDAFLTQWSRRDAGGQTAISEADVQACFAPLPGVRGKFLANLSGLARLRLSALGINQIYGNDGSDAWCTYSQPSVWFSHRRDTAVRGATGRMAACIWLE